MKRTARKHSRRSVAVPELPARPKPFRASFVFADVAASRRLAEHVKAIELEVDCYMTGREFLRDVNAHVPGVVLVHTALADLNISEFLEQIQQLTTKPRVVICAGASRIPDAIRAVSDGAFEVLVDWSSDAKPQGAIVRAYRSWYELDGDEIEGLSEQFENGYERLTTREVKTLELVIKGAASRTIATEFEISVKTVEAHRANISAKMRTDDIGHLVRMWRAWNRKHVNEKAGDRRN